MAKFTPTRTGNDDLDRMQDAIAKALNPTIAGLAAAPSAYSSIDHAAGWVNVKEKGAAGDGGSDDTDAIRSAMTDGAGAEVVFPPGTYRMTSTVVIPDGTIVRFLGGKASVVYYGTGAAFEIRNSKNLAIHDLYVDLSHAGANAVGVWVRGAWFLQLYKPRILGGASTHVGIKIETSYTGGYMPWGAYMIEVHNPNFYGPGLYGIQTIESAADTVRVTHLNVYGGWSLGFSTGLYIRQIDTFQIAGFASDNGVNGIDIDDSAEGRIMPGELGPTNSGYGIVWGASCGTMYLVAPSRASPGGSLGFQNNTSFTPTMLLSDTLSLGVGNYYARLKGNNSYGETLDLIGCSGGAEQKILQWGEAVGLTVDAGSGGTMFKTGVGFATPANATQAGRVYQGSGLPTAGNNGDVYFRTDTPGTVNQRIYVKSAGTWVGIL